VQAAAKALPLPNASASVVWALSSLHDSDDLTKGLAEAGRILAPGGCLLVIERLVPPGARGHAAHGPSESRAEAVAQQLEHAGLVDVSREHTRAGNRTLVILRATRAPT
jgi:SAM-dependent methyltransferase